MNPLVFKKHYFLLILPALAAVAALLTGNFLLKSGTAALGILLILATTGKKITNNKSILYVTVAFAFSIAGDWFLSHMNGNTLWFVYGIGLFFVAHLGYLFYSLSNGNLHKVATAVVLSGFLVFFGVVLYPVIDDKVLMVAALIYLVISCISLGAAFGLKLPPLQKWLYTAGIVLILFSDTIIAYKEFAAYDQLSFLILPTYYLAHILVTASVMDYNSSPVKS